MRDHFLALSLWAVSTQSPLAHVYHHQEVRIILFLGALDVDATKSKT
jgi:hypothetical protein